MADEKDLNIRITTSADMKGVAQSKEAMADAAKMSLHYAVETKKLGEEARAASGHFQGMGRAVYGFREIVGGIQYNRPIELIRGLVNVTMGLGGAFIATAAAITGPFIAALLAMRQVVSDNQKEMKRWWDEAKAGTEDYKRKLEEVTKQAEKDLKAQEKAVEALVAAYRELVSEMDKAEGRVKDLNDANKKLELAKASTPEEKAAVEEKYGKIEAENQGLSGLVRRRNAEEALTGFSEESRGLESGVQAKQDAFENAKADALAYGNSQAPAAKAARNRAFAAKAALDAAKSNQSSALEKMQPGIREAGDQLDKATQDQALAKINAQTVEAEAHKEREKIAADKRKQAAQQAKRDETAESQELGREIAAQNHEEAAEKRAKASAERVEAHEEAVEHARFDKGAHRRAIEDAKKAKEQQLLQAHAHATSALGTSTHAVLRETTDKIQLQHRQIKVLREQLVTGGN